MSTRRFQPMRDLPVVGWLTAAAVAAFLHPVLATPRWLMIHLLLLGAVTQAIVVWSRHFADALLHTPPESSRLSSARLALLNAGALLVVVGVPTRVWAMTLAGAGAVTAAVAWHGTSLLLQVRRALPARFGLTVRYYVAAACFLPIGAGLGAALARGLADPVESRLRIAHATVNVLGWMGLTVAGTLVTLWPTMLRTRIPAGSERAARVALPVLAGSVLVTAGGALAGVRALTALGLLGYLAGVVVVGRRLALAGRAKPPSSFATWSVAASGAWLVATLLWLVVGVATASTWVAAGGRFDQVAPFLAAGFGGQVLLGALAYLIPVALGGGPSPVRAANAVLDVAAAPRVVVVNAAMLVCALPVPPTVRALCSLLAVIAAAGFLPLLVLAIRASRRARTASAAALRSAVRTAVERPERHPGRTTGPAVAGLAVVVLAVCAGVAVNPGGLAFARADATGSAAAGVRPTGRTTTVSVTAADMRFTPDRIQVPAGDRLVIVLTDGDDGDVHDLVLESGQQTGRLAPGQTTRLDVGVVGRDLEGWCSVLGHRQRGMVLHVVATGAKGANPDGAGSAAGPATSDQGMPGHPGMSSGGPASTPGADLHGTPGPGFVARDAALAPLTSERVHRVTLTVSEVERDVAPGVRQKAWTYNGTAPGPVLHGRVGDVFEVTLVNDATTGHSVDFHAGSLAPSGPMRTIPPGGRLLYRFTATKAGVWMYHCSTMPMSVHMAAGLFGAVVIEPGGLVPARSYVLVQSELYLGTDGAPVDVAHLEAERPDAVVFNGYVDQYDHRPLQARAGERVRIWVLDAGPDRPTSFHVVGGQFDRVFAEGAYLLGSTTGDGGSQALALAPGQGGFVELVFPEAGRYPFLSHLMVDAERGAHGAFEVTP